MKDGYQKNGFGVARSFFSEPELAAVEPVLLALHENWLNDNQAFYETGAINSAYITHNKAHNPQDRLDLFNFIASKKLMTVATALVPKGPAFMNTQLFFDPVRPDQKNYWHRDIQYAQLSIDEQKSRFSTKSVLHFRIPFVNERGIDLIPGTHKRWDTERELDTRLKQNGYQPSDDLPDNQVVPLNRGDLLVFSANMIHRGLYGGDRFALDIIFCDTDPELLRFVEPDCLPDKQEMDLLALPEVFKATLTALKG